MHRTKHRSCSKKSERRSLFFISIIASFFHDIGLHFRIFFKRTHVVFYTVAFLYWNLPQGKNRSSRLLSNRISAKNFRLLYLMIAAECHIGLSEGGAVLGGDAAITSSSFSPYSSGYI